MAMRTSPLAGHGTTGGSRQFQTPLIDLVRSCIRGWPRVPRNPLCVVLPCHRVVASSGALTAYSGGLAAKEYLLALESRP